MVTESERERVRADAPARRTRAPLRIRQPESTAALRPSQRRAAERRAALDREHSVEHWLRRLARR
jgi:hypothetical protein